MTDRPATHGDSGIPPPVPGPGPAPVPAPEPAAPPPEPRPAPVPPAPAPPAGAWLRAVSARIRARADRAAADRPADPAAPDPTAAVPAWARQPHPVSIDDQVPRLLRQAAAWAWRLILVAVLIYGAFRIAATLRLVVLPLIAAILLTALLQPLAARLRRIGLPGLAATWATFLLALVIIAGALTLAGNRVSADYPTLAAEVRRTANEVQKSLAGPPFHLNGRRLQQLTNELVHFISQHKSAVAGTVVSGGKIFLEILTGVVLTLFTSFFLLKDGARIWRWLLSGLGPEPHRRMSQAGDAAWRALTGYIKGTTAVAAIHAIFIGLALWLLGVPLLVPLVILVFLAAYIPLIGILVVGALAILVTLGTKGFFAAVILLAVFALENQIESHLLQPLVVGRAVRLYPLAIILVLAVGGVIAGIPGAIVAVPAAAVLTSAVPFLLGHGPPAGTDPSADSGPPAGSGPPAEPGPLAEPGPPAEPGSSARPGPPADQV
jgi:predicted PurR-regulated permease PerM